MKLARKFLEAGDKVRIMVKFVGREITHPELGENILAQCVEEAKDVSEVELAPSFEGKKLSVTLRPLNAPAKP
jgi:translation initiation factor IF-3